MSESVEKICRACLKQNIPMRPIFDGKAAMEDSTLLSEAFTICSSILLKEDDGLPNSICFQCFNLVKQAYSFRLMCLNSNYKLKHCDEINSNAISSIEKPELDHNKENHNCNLCDTTFNTINLYRKHLAVKHNLKEKKLTCEICKKSFKFPSNLLRHKLTHSGEKPYLCNICGKTFTQTSYLKMHTFTHTGERPYACKICKKSFTTPGTLTTHMRIHSGEKPHICRICGKGFSQSGYLQAHIRTHTGEKPAECKICNKKFTQKGKLLVHMRMHSGEKPFECNICGKYFAIKGTLKKHIRTHTGEKPYVCKICGQSFSQNGTLSNHIKKVHKNK